MAGRRPKPAALKQLAGNPGKRRLPKVATPTESGKAAMPLVVKRDSIAREEWDRLAPQLELLALIDSQNQQLFAAYCLSWSMYCKAQAQVLREGFTYRAKNGQRKKHPAFEAMRAAGAEMRKFGIEFGITPASRAKVTPGAQPNLPGIPPKPDQPTMPPGAAGTTGNERFFGPGPTTVN